MGWRSGRRPDCTTKALDNITPKSIIAHEFRNRSINAGSGGIIEGPGIGASLRVAVRPTTYLLMYFGTQRRVKERQTPFGMTNLEIRGVEMSPDEALLCKFLV